ncbi:MAG: BREX-4 system phosphatase PglZ [Bacteroidales bacterium]|nr:BREX-4 system phosphatase PglZ [Bacteroidales bacterium]
MDASDKIIRFDSYEALLDEIKRDMTDGDPLRCRYPVRFILLNNFDVFTKFAQDLAHHGVSPLNLEELIENTPDRWITTDELCQAIKDRKVRTLVTPFSELVRFYSENDFRGFFNEIMINTEDVDRPEKRIYIPLIGLQNRFSNFLNSFARIEESAPVWAYLSEEQKTKVFLTTIKNEANSNLKKGSIVVLNTLYDWLRFWKNQAPQTQIVCSSGPINRREKNSDPDNIFTFEHIQNSHQYIESFLGINVPFAYKESEEDYWAMLLADILKSNPASFSFSSYVSALFGFAKVAPRDLFYRWVLTDTIPYHRWLLKNYFLSSSVADKYPYLKICLEELTEYETYSELSSKVAERIFYFSQPHAQMQFASEREFLMKRSSTIFIEFTDKATESYIKTCISEISQNNIQLAIALTTGVFDFEKVMLTAWYADRDHTGLSLEKAAEKYPDLRMYLSDLKPSEKKQDNWYLYYFDAYREAKLSDEITEKIHSYITEKNHDENSFYGWYHSFNETHDLLNKHISSNDLQPDKVYWIDALGAEFLPFLLSVFEEESNGYRVIHSEVTRCTIPSATSQNRFDNVVKFGELDEIAHDSTGYQKNSTLVKELTILAKKMWEIMISNSHGEHTIAIVSDHGLSCLSRKAESKKYDAKVEHDGRYIKVPADGKLYHDSDYVVHINENDGERYKIALTHSSLGRKPVHEVHGGCTPEEVLVPYLIITNKKQNLTRFKYELVSKELEVSEPVVSVVIMPQPSKVKLTIDNQEYNMTRSAGKWSVRVEGLEEGEYKVDISIPGGTSHSETIKVIGTGFGGNDFLKF